MADSKELMKLDFYDILNLSIEARDNEIKKSYRKAALACHPDKNPDNPKAAAEFDRLQKILKILLDPGTRSAYDKLLKGRQLAALRAREASAKNQKLRNELERREEEARNKLSDAERFTRELRRLEEEGEKIIAEELERLRREVREEKLKAAKRLADPVATEGSSSTGSYRVKVRWVTPENAEPYTKEMIHNLFYKWGELNAVAVKQKGAKGTALVDYKEKSGADMAIQFEKGLEQCPVTVSALEVKPPPATAPPQAQQPDSEVKNKRDYESLADMEKRRKNERARLIAEMLSSDGVED